MIRNVLTHIGGVEMYGIISVLLFFAFFVGMLVWAFCLNSAYLESMRQLPLHGGEGGDGEATDENLLADNTHSNSRTTHEAE